MRSAIQTFLSGRAAVLLAAAIAAAAMTAAPMTASTAAERPHAVVLMYHRFGETDYPSTNVRLAQFDAHIEELTSGKYTVRPLSEIVDALINNRPLADRTVAITIDDAYASVYRQAWPRLKKAGLPFTVFVSTDQPDRQRGYMSWDQIRELAADGVEIGHHGAGHAHMASISKQQVAVDFARSSRRFEETLGAAPKIFAYPYGEVSLALKSQVAAAGLKAAFGQHSGVAVAGGEPFYLPRFAINETYGGTARFRLAVNALPIPIREVAPVDMKLGANPPAYGFTVTDDIPGIGRLNCFASHLPDRVRIERLGARRFEVRFDQPFPAGRSRINCTMRTKDGRWRWLGRQFFVPKS
jgi:peptidoglycan/xylan/chitin deacetylase (PgdA/CDA1 family)